MESICWVCLIMLDSSLTHLNWDSAFFNNPIYHVANVDDFIGLRLDSLPTDGLIQAKISADQLQHIDALQSMGFKLDDSDVCFSKEIKASETDEEVLFDFDMDKHSEAMLSIASKAFTQSRFRAPWFDVHDASRFYVKWVENAINRTYDDVALVTTIGNEVSGFVSGKIMGKNEARIGLICTDPLHQGQGVGPTLLFKFEQWVAAQKVGQLTVATQGSNLNAINFYLRNHYLLNEISYWFYK